MDASQIKILKDSYNKESTRPNGTKSTLGEYMRFITDCNIEFVSSKDMVLCDDANNIVHCVCVNEDMVSQATFPVKIISAPYEDVHAIETIMSRENFESFLDEGFFSNIEGWSDEKKEFMKKWARGLKIQAQQSPYATPFHTDTAGVISMPNLSNVRDDGITTITNNSASKITVSSVDSEASIIEAIAAGKSVILNEDITLEADQLTIDRDIMINLNGHTLTAAAGKNAIRINNGNVTINDGNIISSGNVALYVDATNGGAPSLTLGNNVNINTDHCGVFIKGDGAVLNSAANITATGVYGAIQTNGSANAGGVTVNITGGEISAQDAAIYFPCKTMLNISGGAKITGYTGIYHKSGRLIINDATVIGTGDKVEYTYNANGCNSTGDAVVIEACNYPGGVPIVNIIDGTFISENASAIGYYQQSEDYTMSNEKFIIGGTFNTDVSDYLANGYIQNSNGKVVKDYQA